MTTNTSLDGNLLTVTTTTLEDVGQAISDLTARTVDAAMTLFEDPQVPVDLLALQLDRMRLQMSVVLSSAEGFKFFENNSIDAVIEGGSCSVIRKIKITNGRYYIQKMAIDDYRQEFNAECEALRVLIHPNIVKLFYVDKDSLYMEYIEGDTLENNWMELTEKEAIRVFKQIADALSYIHENGYIHGDLHGSNVFITTDKKKAKLIDLGQAHKSRETSEEIAFFGGLINSWIKRNKSIVTGPVKEGLSELASRCIGPDSIKMTEALKHLSYMEAKFDDE